jgi:Zn finger protein HypA/HybF involved in hydrogenase expression
MTADNGISISVRPPSFTCPRCGRVSHNPTDIAEGYCGACHDRTARPERPDDYLAGYLDDDPGG